MNNLALFASGSGSNVENIAKYFKKNNSTNISCVYINNPNAYVIERCINLGLPYKIFTREDFYDSDTVLSHLNELKPDLIVLAGFLWLIPSKIVKAFQGKIINIHPALLPKYGGKGMYGMKVHEAVVQNKDTETGITIHYVNEKYDEGSVIFQKSCAVTEADSAEEVAHKVHALEHEHFPKLIEDLLNK